MNIQFSNWQLINLNDLDNNLNNAGNEFASIFNEFDAYSVFTDIVTNTRITGTWYSTGTEFNVDLRGNHFIDDVPIETVNSLSLTDSTRNLLVTGSVTYNYDYGLYSGYFNKFSYVSTDIASQINLLIEGRFNVDSFTGEFSGGTSTKYNITFNGNTLNLAGSLLLNADEDIIGGTITSFTIADNLGHSFVASNLSLSAVDFYNLTNPLANSDLNAFFSYMSDPLRLTGNDTITADENDNNISGYAGNDILNGGAGADTLNGGAGADTLNGGIGADSMEGGDGNDTYIVDDEGDTVTETNALATGGIDLVKSSALNFTLGSNVENLTLTDNVSVNGGTAAINGTGNALANTITGNAGDNTLDGGAGVDRLNGGLGNDKYIVDLVQTGTTAATFRVALQDVVTEALNAGSDTLELRGNFDHLNTTTLTLGANLEILDASNTALTKLNLTGNTLNNTIIGNDANNTLLGGAGNDELNGGGGNDTLDGGIGEDTLKGGAGDDTYLVDIKAVGITPNISVELQDSIDEGNGTGDGIDTLKLRGSVVIPAATAAQEIALTGALASIENLDASLTGATRLNLTGNNEDNILIGNAAANTLTGGDGMDFLDGKAGADTMIGGLGVDVYVVDNIGDVVIEQPDEGDLDMINSFISFDLSTKGANVEYLNLVGTATIGTGNDLNNSIYGNSLANILAGGAGDDYINGGLGNDTLNGGIGADSMEGGNGNDTYIVDDEGDTVTETNAALATGGIDLVKSVISFDLSTKGVNVENLTLTDNVSVNGGTAAINGTGNALANTITGNAGDNTLDGGAGVDRLNGGLGNDKYIVDLVQTGTTAATFRVALQDVVTEALNAGSDTLELRGNFDHLNTTTLTLGANLEILDASNTALTKLNLTGNTLNNTIIGNDANNTLLGGAGNDELNGGGGNDTLDGGIGEDTLKGGAGDDTYLVDIKAVGITPNISVELQDSIDEGNGTGDGIDTLKLRGSVVIPAATAAQEIALTGALASIENLDASLTGATRLNLTGNNEDNILIGNAAANTLNGGLGNDTLNGGLGNDTMIGGDGDDTYFVNVATDVVTELENEGIDTIKSTITYSLVDTDGVGTNGDNVENLELLGTAAINATGNDLDNILTGNAAANILSGGIGSDTLFGSAGNDTLNGGADNDTIIGGIGNDILIGGEGADIFKWGLTDKGTKGVPSIDRITDFDLAQNDVLDLRDLLVGESSENLLNYLDIRTNAGNTEIRISSTGSFAAGNYGAGNEDARIVLTGYDLFSATGTGSEADLIQNLISNNNLIVD